MTLAPDTEAIYAELLALRCRQGDQQAYRELIACWEKRLFFYIRRLVAHEEDAWDVLQQVWLKAFRGMGSLKDTRRVPAWLYGIARNTAFSHLRATRHQQMQQVDPDAVGQVEASDDSLALEDAERVHRALDQISLAHKEAITLFLLEDLTMDQTAEVLGIPLGTVKSRLHHAKRALRAAIEREGRQ
ncbi:MAG: sigma-70 family RNA polymerase sigma factor [Phycisphaerae bacterium]|nr:sigma-70 family RNA polymerase sigma factor [Phycisphaerae bacterium]